MSSKFVGAVILALTAIAGASQQAPPPAPVAEHSLAEVVQQLSQQVSELKAAVAEMRTESARYREEARQLRQQLQAAMAPTEQRPPSGADAEMAAAPAVGSSSNERLRTMQDDLSLLAGKVDDQYQTKLESGSKYRVRFSGLVLLNMFGNGGTVNSADLPFTAVPTITGGTQRSFGGTLRQSQLRFEVFGPTWAGARTRAEVDMDFVGGFPQTENGVSFGLARLRTATMRFDWDRTSIIAGQDAPFFSPLSPTSLATLAQPALSYAGNLWTWIPQVRIEHRIATGESSELSLQGGVLDPLSGEEPPLQFDRLPQAGESSRQPAFATRMGWRAGHQDRSAAFGVGGFYSRQNWKFMRKVDAWAATADWSLPFARLFTLSGEFYRGRAVGGLGGAIDRSVVFFGPETLPNSPVRGLDSMGGWAQVAYQVTPKVEFNVAAGQDNPFASQFRDAAMGSPVYNLEITRNRSALVNFIYHPRSNLLLSAEYRRIDTFHVDSSSRNADHVDLAVGVLF